MHIALMWWQNDDANGKNDTHSRTPHTTIGSAFSRLETLQTNRE